MIIDFSIKSWDFPRGNSAPPTTNSLEYPCNWNKTNKIEGKVNSQARSTSDTNGNCGMKNSVATLLK